MRVGEVREVGNWLVPLGNPGFGSGFGRLGCRPTGEPTVPTSSLVEVFFLTGLTNLKVPLYLT